LVRYIWEWFTPLMDTNDSETDPYARQRDSSSGMQNLICRRETFRITTN
jgi:hypothetical protein